MKKLVSLFFFVLLVMLSHAQKDILVASTRAQLIANLDSALRSEYYINLLDAGKILEKPAYLKDSTYKLSGGILRYSFDYVAKYVDSTSKGKISFSLEQYKDTSIAKSTYDFLKSQNQKDGEIVLLKELGDDAFLKKDYLNQPFIMVLKDNKIFKYRVFFLTSETSLNALISVSKKIAS